MGRGGYRDGRAFHATAAIITLPLGVLQARRVAFAPQPVEILAAADRLVMGPAARVVYEFDHGFWSNSGSSLKGVSFLFAPDATPPTWWTTAPRPGSMLTGWVAGRKASKLNPAELPETGLATLGAVLGDRCAQAPAALAPARLAGRYPQPGRLHLCPRGAIDASDELSVPVEATLFFAGEHTDISGHWGTVHGALRSGYRVAEQVLRTAEK